MARCDVHRPSTIVASDYRYGCEYSLATTMDGWPVPAWNMDTVIRIQGECASGGKRRFGSPGQCGICGARFIYGALWYHDPTGDIVHLGHECARKYEFLGDHTTAARERAAFVEKELRRQARERFLAENPGLEIDFAVEHPIIFDIRERFLERAFISDKQVALVRKLADEARNPKPAEAHVAAPTGRIDFTGLVVSLKDHETNFGTQTKLTVKIFTDAGCWLAWGTCPRQLLDEKVRRGDVVELRATLKPGKDAHFALMSRPIGRVTSYQPDHRTYTAQLKYRNWELDQQEEQKWAENHENQRSNATNTGR